MSSSSSWKKYGGINKLDKMNFLNVNSIVTDTMTLHEAYVGAFDICGNVTISEKLYVNDKTTFNNDIHISENVDISKNVIVDGNVEIKGNAIFNTPQSTFFNKLYFGSDNKQYFYGDPSGMGINIEKPNATLDICSNRVDCLNVFSNLTTNRNIIARNAHHKGIAVSVDNSNSTIDFFNDASINPLNMHDGRIQYQKGGIMVIDVSDNIYVASKFAVSNRDASAHVMRETAVIYDICNNTYAYNIYDISSANTGNALSLISSDNSSNTFLNIITPGKNGLSIGGGAYPLDRKKAMGTIGIYDASADVYRPTQNIVRGNSLVKYKTTLGINTHAPRIDNYVVDINGPIHLTNGELTNVSSNNFEIKNIVFSRTNKDYGLAFGTPYSIINGINDVSANYAQKILYTKNGGKSWSESRIVDNFAQNGHNTDLEKQPINFYSGYVYDQNYSIIGGDRNYLFYSNDGGQKWNNIVFENSSQNAIDLSQFGIIGVYIGERDNPVSDYKRFIVLYYDKFIIFDTSLNGLNANMTANNTITIPIINNDIRSITDGNICSYMHGYGNFVYIVGTKISKYNINTKEFVSLPSHEGISDPSGEYNSVYAYDDNYVIAVGDKIISYTKNGSDTNDIWTDISMNASDLDIQNITLQSIYILDSSYAMAVGNNGKIIYSTDGAVTWKTAANDVMNSSGNANTLINSGYNLNGIVMQDTNSFIVSTLVTQQSSNQELGKTNIIYSFLPNLMNRDNNYVFDVSGNMGIDGDIRINNGTIMVKDTRQSTSTTSGALQISGGAGIAKDTYIGGNLIINSSRNADVDEEYDRGAVHVKNGGLYVQGNTHINTNLTVQGRLFTRSGIVSTGTVVYNSDASFSSGTATLRKRVDGSQNEITSSTRPVQGSVVIDTNEITGKKGGLYVSGNTYIGGNWLDVDGNIVVNKDLSVGGAFTPNTVNVIGNTNATALNTGTFMVNYGGASIGGNIYIGGNFVLSGNSTGYGTSYIEKEAMFNSKVDVSGIVVCNNVADSVNNATGSLVVKGGVGINKSVNIGGITKINNVNDSGSIDSGALVVVGGVGIGGNIFIGGNSYTDGNSNITGNCNIQGNTNATGNIIISNNNNTALQISNGGLYIGGTFPASGINTGALQIPNGGASINGNLFLGGNISVGGGNVSTSTTSGALVVTGGAGISGNTNIGGNLSVTGVSNLTGNITIGTGGVAKVNSIATSLDTLNGALVVGGGVGIGENINIGGRANIAGDTSIGNSLINTPSTGISTGALIVKGGVGVTGNTNIGGITKITTNTESNRFDQGALVVTGGVGIGGNVYIDSSLNVNRGFNLTGNINLTGFANFNNETDSVTVDDGAFIVKGGVAIKKSLNVGGVAKIVGLTTINNVSEYDTGSSTGGAFIVTGGVNISKNSRFGSINTFNGGVTSGDTGTGSLVVTGTGGVGIGGNINVGGVANITGVTTIGLDSSSTAGNAFVVKGGVSIRNVTTITSSNVYDGTAGTGAFIVTGGVNIGGNSRFGAVNTFNGGVTSSGNGTGSLVVTGTGGVGIGGNINVGGVAKIDGVTTIGNTTQYSTTGTGAFIVSGGINIAGNSRLGGVNTFDGNVTSGNTTSGSLVVTGGVGISGAINVGGFANIAGVTRITGNNASGNTTSGALVVTGGIGISENINVGGDANITGVTTIGLDSSSTSGNAFIVKGGVSIRNVTSITSNNAYNGTAGTGALIVGGGINIAGNSRLGGVNTFDGGVTSGNTTSGSLVVTGGVGISGAINVGGTATIGGVTRITGNTASGNTTSGSLVVTGGVGVSGQVNAGSFNAASDYRIKENVTRLDDSFSVDKLEPVRYYNTMTKRDDIGFIAHKVQELYPYLVNGEKDSADYQTLNYIGLIGILVREIQELKQKVNELENRFMH